jgi:hypothetical protein
MADSLSDVMSGGNGGEPPANPTNPQTVPAESQPGSDPKQGSETGKDVKLAAWTQQVSKEYRENPEVAAKLANLEKLDDLVKGYLDAQGKTDIPGKDAKPEDLDAFWKKLGYPEKPENYSVSKDKNAETFISAAHAARLTDEQATALWKSVSEGTARQFAAVQEAQKAELDATDAALKKEYGDKYSYALEMFKRGIGNDELKDLIRNAGLAGKPAIVKAFIALGEAAQESGSPKSDSGLAGGMKSIFEGGGFKYADG